MPPNEACEFRPEWLLDGLRTAAKQVVGELPPVQLPEESITAQTIDRMPDLASADFPESQVRRKTGSGGDSGMIPQRA